ncbi:hypothetical protein GUJ93_ZPchr0004g39061 [Zizania palustris]|uniref:Uncharacterized protein n=1 Tax=Zizania palustris TaxID=103762 RepID=A0A8J5VPD9_ZIZPA|nr:hypothetical protein GUJ93_ZPchr0004g39061 [Zizania palustris]
MCSQSSADARKKKNSTRTQGVRCFGDERLGRRCGLYVGLSFTSRLDTLTQGWVVALITTRLRSTSGYPAMATRCTLLAPGRRAPPARRALVPNDHPCFLTPHQRPTTASPTRAARAIRIARTSLSHLVLAGRDAPTPMARSKQYTCIHNSHTPLIVKLSSNNHSPKLDVATPSSSWLHWILADVRVQRRLLHCVHHHCFASPPFAMIRIVRPPRPRDVHAFPGWLLVHCKAPAFPTPHVVDGCRSARRRRAPPYAFSATHAELRLLRWRLPQRHTLGFAASGSSIRRQTPSSLAPATHAIERITLDRIDT